MRLVIVEDDRLLRENLTILLSGEYEITVAEVFSNAEEAIPGIRTAKPDVLLVDLGLPGLSGIELIRQVKRSQPDIEIMAHTVFDSRDAVFSAIKAGASGYLLKGCTPRELIEALHDLNAGGAPMSPKIARSVIREFQDRAVENQYILTPREKQILLGLEEGLTYFEVGENLHISRHTVHTHIKNIYDKLHAKSREEALVKARKKGII